MNLNLICKVWGIKNYHIDSEALICVDGDVNLRNKGLTKLPLSFSYISGDFNCSSNKLKTLIGSPYRVDNDFCCSFNNLTDLIGGPTYIGGTFWCESNKNIENFDGFPRHAKSVNLTGTPILPIFNIFSDIYLADGGKWFSTSGTLMDHFWDCNPIFPRKVIKVRRMNNFLSAINKKLNPNNINTLENFGWKIEN